MYKTTFINVHAWHDVRTFPIDQISLATRKYHNWKTTKSGTSSLPRKFDTLGIFTLPRCWEVEKIITSFLHNWVSIAVKGRMKNYIASCTRECGWRKVFITAKPHNKRKLYTYMKWMGIPNIMQNYYATVFMMIFSLLARVVKKLCNKTFHQQSTLHT